MRIDTTTIAKILEVSHDTARRMCVNGLLKTARRKMPGVPRSPWTADESEVRRLRDGANLPTRKSEDRETAHTRPREVEVDRGGSRGHGADRAPVTGIRVVTHGTHRAQESGLSAPKFASSSRTERTERIDNRPSGLLSPKP